MKDDLIKRYIYAVTCNLPAKSQGEIEKEIDNMIAELIDARCGGKEPSDADIRAVLLELGPPEELAVKYSGDENKALISGIYLIWYKKILKIVLPIAAAGVAFAVLLSKFIEWQPPQDMYFFIPEIVSTVISGALDAAVQAFLWITVIFIILERNKIRFSGDDFLSNLHPVPDKKAQIKIHEPIINIFWHIVSPVLLLGFPYLIGAYSEKTGWIPVFNEDYIHASWYLVVLWAALGVVCEIFKLIERRYSRRLALAVIVSNLLIAISSALFFADNGLMNPVFIDKFGTMISESGADGLSRILGQTNIIILAIILFALFIDTCVASFRAIRYDR